jgi:hypothetical protein
LRSSVSFFSWCSSGASWRLANIHAVISGTDIHMYVEYQLVPVSPC